MAPLDNSMNKTVYTVCAQLQKMSFTLIFDIILLCNFMNKT